jgi:hypothetical protein
MKSTLLITLLTVASVVAAKADGPISDAMKKYHKGETSTVKKIGEGEGSSSDISSLLSAYQAMAAAKPQKGTPLSWEQKTGAVIEALKGMPATKGKFKMAVNCKACHDVHKGK